jgi:hypothetical protein
MKITETNSTITLIHSHPHTSTLSRHSHNSVNPMVHEITLMVHEIPVLVRLVGETVYSSYSS